MEPAIHPIETESGLEYRPRRTVSERVKRWVARRDYRRILGGIPALLAAGALAAAAIFTSGWKPAHVEGRWRDLAGEALDARNYTTAVTAYRALLQLRGETQMEYRFKLAQSLHELGREREAGSLLRALAPISRPVHAPAHLYIAQLLLAQTNLVPYLRGAIEQQLNHVLALQPDDPEAHELLGKVFTSKGQLEEAKHHFLKAVPKRGEAAMLLAAVLEAQGDEKGASGYYQRAQLFFRERLTQKVGDELEACRGLCRAMTALGDYRGALAVVEPLWKLNERPEYANEIARICAGWSLAMAREKNAATNRLKVVEQGLQHAPKDLVLLGQLAELVDLNGPAAKTAQARLDQMLADPELAPLVNFCLGLKADRAGDVPNSRKFYQLAYDRRPHNTHACNNLAWALAQEPNPDLPRALELIDLAIRNQPREPRYRDTRGQILAKLGRHREAVSELEVGLTSLPDSAKPAAFRVLAQSYAALGLQDMAASYTRLADPAKR